MDERTLAAFILKCNPDDLLGFSQIGEGRYKAIGPSGAVHYLSYGDLQRAVLTIAGQVVARLIKAEGAVPPKPATASPPKPAPFPPPVTTNPPGVKSKDLKVKALKVKASRSSKGRTKK